MLKSLKLLTDRLFFVTMFGSKKTHMVDRYASRRSTLCGKLLPDGGKVSSETELSREKVCDECIDKIAGYARSTTPHIELISDPVSEVTE